MNPVDAMLVVTNMQVPIQGNSGEKVNFLRGGSMDFLKFR